MASSSMSVDQTTITGDDTSSDAKRQRTSHRSVLRVLKKKSLLRRKLLSKEFGLSSSSELGRSLCGRREHEEIKRLQVKINPAKYRFNFESRRSRKETKTDEQTEAVADGDVDTYKDSNVFLKGTQSANPHNDYAQHFVDTGQRAQNFIRDVGKEERFREYPKLHELIRLKDKQIRDRGTQPMYLNCDLKTFDLSMLESKFDVIHVTPPLEQYQRRASGVVFPWKPWEWEEVMALKLEEIAAQRSFVFLWCGSAEGLDMGRECFRKWGYRRCEDICWVKTNTSCPGNTGHLDPKAILVNVKEHCLMGIKGTVRRNQDGHFIHANIDLDIIITEEPELGNIEKPEEIFDVIEHFCLGRRRLHLFGNDSTIRPGWLTVGPEITSSNFSKELYSSFFTGTDGFLMGQIDEIESKRPKTPPPRGGGRGSGRGRGATSGPGRGRGRGSGF